MPTPFRHQPQFSPYGRYLINVRERHVEGPTYFHNTENYQPECKIEEMPTVAVSRFNNKAWALQRGYQSCNYCHA